MASPSLISQEQRGDYLGISVQSSQALTGSYQYTSEFDVRTFEDIDWFIHITNATNVTEVDVQIQSAETQIPINADFTTLQTETIDNTGTATLNDYTLKKTISTTINILVSAPVRGRWMRIGIKTGAGTGVGSAYDVAVLRRKSRALGW